MNPSLLPYRVFVTINAIFLNGNNQSKWFLASCLEGLPWGEGCHQSKLAVTPLLCVVEAQSWMQLQVCAKDVPSLLPEFCGVALTLLGVLPGAGSVSGWGTTTAWGS